MSHAGVSSRMFARLYGALSEIEGIKVYPTAELRLFPGADRHDCQAGSCRLLVSSTSSAGLLQQARDGQLPHPLRSKGMQRTGNRWLLCRNAADFPMESLNQRPGTCVLRFSGIPDPGDPLIAIWRPAFASRYRLYRAARRIPGQGRDRSHRMRVPARAGPPFIGRTTTRKGVGNDGHVQCSQVNHRRGTFICGEQTAMDITANDGHARGQPQRRRRITTLACRHATKRSSVSTGACIGNSALDGGCRYFSQDLCNWGSVAIPGGSW